MAARYPHDREIAAELARLRRPLLEPRLQHQRQEWTIRHVDPVGIAIAKRVSLEIVSVEGVAARQVRRDVRPKPALHATRDMLVVVEKTLLVVGAIRQE